MGTDASLLNPNSEVERRFCGDRSLASQIIPLPLARRSSGGTHFGDAVLSQFNVASTNGLGWVRPPHAAASFTTTSRPSTPSIAPHRNTATTPKFDSEIKAYHLVELARGDFNHDGFEDSLVEANWHYREGSGRGGELWLVQRVASGPLKIEIFDLR